MLVDTNKSLELLKLALTNPLGDAELAKAITQATGLVQFDLQAPALSLFPVLTPLRNKVPRVKGRGGTGANWKAITAINTTKQSAGVSEGNRGAVVTTAVSSYLAAYAGLGLEDYVTFEAEDAAEGFQDVQATATLNLLRAVMIAEEQVILGGQGTWALGVTPTPTVATSTSGGAIATGLTISVIAVALTLDGFQRAVVGAAGCPVGPLAKTNADGSVDNFGPGVAQKSANATVVTGAGSANSVTASVAPVSGAVAYAWYMGSGAGNERIAAITTINSILFTALPAGGNQLASALPASDQSQNSLVFDGFLAQAYKSGSTAYIVSQPNGTLGTGTPLTTDGAAGIVEIVTAFKYFWDNFRLSPSSILCNSQELQNISKKVIANGGAPLIRMTTDANAEHSLITAGAKVKSIFNPFTQTMVDLDIHPNMPAGTIMFITDTVPYPLPGVGNLYQIKTRREYYQINWPRRSRKDEYGVYCDEVLQHYAPFTLGIINNIGNG